MAIITTIIHTPLQIQTKKYFASPIQVKIDTMNIKISLILLIAAALSAALVCGCTTSQPASPEQSGDIVNVLEVTASDPVWHTNPDGSCYYVSQIDVLNVGENAAKNVMIRCHLKDDTGNIVNTNSQYYEVIDAGDHKGFTVTIDGDCGGKGKFTIVAVATQEKQ